MHVHVNVNVYVYAYVYTSTSTYYAHKASGTWVKFRLQAALMLQNIKVLVVQGQPVRASE